MTDEEEEKNNDDKVTCVASGEQVDLDERFKVLNFDQVFRLHEVIQDTVPIHGRGNYPTLELKCVDLIAHVQNSVRAEGLEIRSIRINGGAASYILGSEEGSVLSFNDLDLIFELAIDQESDIQKIKTAVLGSLLNFLPKGATRDKLNAFRMKDAYVQKLIKVWTPTDRWSLISLTNRKGKNIELKFVDRMKRQFEFSVDSFQIMLDSLLQFYQVNSNSEGITKQVFPTVIAESVYGDFEEAFEHLQKKQIATKKPEQIRGGGLLKYCHLMTKGYHPAPDMNTSLLERYMCSRFFIDFSRLEEQQQKLERYLENHMRSPSDQRLQYDFLMTLYDVVQDGTICLMSAERAQILDVIYQLAMGVMYRRRWSPAASTCSMPSLPSSCGSSCRATPTPPGYMYPPVQYIPSPCMSMYASPSSASPMQLVPTPTPSPPTDTVCLDVEGSDFRIEKITYEPIPPEFTSWVPPDVQFLPYYDVYSNSYYYPGQIVGGDDYSSVPEENAEVEQS